MERRYVEVYGEIIMNDEKIRKFEGKIDIIYGQIEDSGEVQYFSVPNNSVSGGVALDSAIGSSLMTVNESNILHPIFQFDRYKLGDKGRLIDNNRIYMNYTKEYNSSEIINNRIIITLGNPRHVENWIFKGITYTIGSDKYFEMPTKFNIYLYSEGKTDAEYSGSVTSELINNEIVYTQSFRLNGVLKTNKFKTTTEEIIVWFEAKYPKIKKIVIDFIEARVFKEDNQGILYNNDASVYEPTNMYYGVDNRFKISKLFDGDVETYIGNAISNFEVSRSLSDSEGDINYGLVSNSCKLRLFNEVRKFDQGYLSKRVSMGKRVVPFIKDCSINVGQASTPSEPNTFKCLGNYYISSWEIPMDNSWVDIEAQDRLYDLHEAIYPGFIPHAPAVNQPFESVTMYDILLTVLDAINNAFDFKLSNIEYSNKIEEPNKKSQVANIYQAFNPNVENYSGRIIEGIDLALTTVVVPNPYLAKQPLWDVLDNIAKATLSYIYIDNNGRLICKSDLNDLSHIPYGESGTLATPDVHGPSSKARETLVSQITPDNAFKMSKPMTRKGYATEVSMSYTTYEFDATENNERADFRYYFVDTAPYKIENGKYYYKFYLPEYLISAQCIMDNGSGISLSEENTNQPYYECIIDHDEAGEWKKKFVTITGYTIKSNNKELNKRLYDELDHNETVNFSTGDLVNNEDSARILAGRVIELYTDGREIFDTEWVGDLDLDLGQAINFELPHGSDEEGKREVNTYRVVKINTKFDGSLRQQIKALSYPLKNIG